MEVVSSIATKVAEVLVVPIGKQIRYPFKYNANMKELEKQVHKLTCQREMVQHAVDAARRHGEEIDQFVEDWINSVDEFAEKVVKPISDERDEAGKLCSVGFCSNLMRRYSLSKKAEKLANDGIRLFRKATFQKVSHRPAIRRTKTWYSSGYEDFGSRMRVFDEIMKAVVDEDVNLVGVYGMGGVGKTALVKRVAAQAIEDKLFDVIVMAQVTQIPDIESLQQQIADELDFKFHRVSRFGRAAELRERLKKETSILLILDGIWEKLDLDAVGIPFWSDEMPSNANKRKWKLLLTTRDLDVLSYDMNTQKNFFIDVLSDVEATDLFWKIVSPSKEEADFKPIVVEIVRKCAGLPIAITTIANALKNKDLSDWKNALQWLRKSNPKPIKGMDTKVYSTIELSYNVLASEEQSLFLLCSLIDSGFGLHTNDLFKYSMGLNLFKDVYTLEEGRDRMDALISNLKASCLLLDGNAKDRVKMHDIVHAVAVSIASSNDKLMFNIQNVTSIKEMLEEKLPKDSIAVCHPGGNFKELPEILEFPNMKFLHLSQIELLSLQIPDALFNHAKELKVLDLTNFDLSSLPSSFCKLTNLQTLCLHHCLIGDITIIGELKKLEILSFLGSKIEQLPIEIRQLTSLRLLDLSGCSKLEVIKPNVISSLTLLEELYMGNSFVQWDVTGQSNASLVELKQLSCLTALDIEVPNVQMIPQDLSFEKLVAYRIFIGDVWDWSAECETSRTLKLELSSSSYLGNEIQSLLNSAEDVYLDVLKGCTNVVDELNGKGFLQLKHLRVQNGSEIQYIANVIGEVLSVVFPSLESLFLNNLINLEMICYGQVTPMSFSKLRTLTVRKCDRLKHLFSSSMAKNLSQLQEIKLIDCEKLEEIFFKESDEPVHQNETIEKIEFSQLLTLTLESLPQLTTFGVNAFTPDIGSQEIIAQEDEASSFTSLFSQSVVLPSLEKLKLSSINIQCKWLDQLPAMSSSRQTLTSLTLEDCSGNLKFVFSYSVVEWLVLLEKLAILNCKSIEGIINTEELKREGEVIMMVFPKLINLQLKGLPNLKQFGSGNPVEFPSLTQLSIEDCPELKTFCSALTLGELNCQDDIHPLFNEKVGFPGLEKMIISGMDNLESIWHDQVLGDSFCKLKSVEVNDCQMLTTILPSFLSGTLSKLESITVKRCGLVEEIFDLQGLEKHSIETVQLKALFVDNLSNLKHIWNNDPKGMLSYGELQKVTVFLCPNLKNLFPASVGRSLVNLESLEVSDCGVEEIIANEGMKEEAVGLFFWQLKSLQLHNLPELTIFYQAEHTVEVPCLKTFGLHHCDKVNPPFLLRKLEGTNLGFLNLEELQLSGNAIEMTKQGQVSFGLLRSLELNDHESTDFPLDFIQKFGSLRKLSLNFGSYTQIFSDAEVKEHPQIKHLVLSQLYNLQQIWKPGSEIDLYSQNLEILQVRSCVSLTNLMPSSSSFEKLTILEVWGCEQLKNLLTFSTAKSLVQLEKLEVFDCTMLTEIVANGGAATEEITFSKMKSLSLSYLESLASFCPGKHNLNFPILESLVVNECPVMKIFSGGAVNRPRHCQLELNWKAMKRSGEVDINTTMQQNFEKGLLGREDCNDPSTD